MEHESNVYANYNLCSWYSHQRINKVMGGVGQRRTSENHPNYCITEIGENIEKTHGDLRRFAVTQTTVKDLQLTLI